MKKTREKILTLLLAGTMLLTACGGSTAPATAETTGAAGTTAAEATAAETIQGTASESSDHTFVYVAQQLINSIDPAKVKDETEVIAAVNLYDPLFYPDMEHDSMDPTEHIATGYEVSEDGTTYTVKVRDDVAFQSGNKMTSADVAYSMERMVAINEGNAWLWSDILESVETPDDMTVVFKLKNPYAPFVSSLTQLFIVDSKLLKENEKDGDYGQEYIGNNSCGSGPYKMTEWDRQSSIGFEAFEDYWKGWSDGQLKEVQMMTITEEATVKTLLASGEADMVHQWLAVSAYADLAKNEDIYVDAQPSAKLQYFPMNTQKAPTDDPYVREAIAYAFDYDTALDDILGGSGAAAGPVPTVVPGHNNDIQPIKQDMDKAKEALAKSKYAGQDITLTFQYLGDNVMQGQFTQLFTANMAELGIKVELVPVTWAQITEAAAAPETTANLTIISDSLKYPHVDCHTYGVYHSSAAGSYRSMSWYSTPELDKVLEDARKATDPDEQFKLYGEAQQMAADAYPAVYMANPMHNVAMRKNITGYKFVGLMGYDISFYSLRKN